MSFLKTRLSIMMFLQYAIWGSWTTALAAHLSKIGYSGPQIGAIYGCLWLACMIAPFIGGQIVDRFFPTQLFLAAAHLIGAVLLFLTSKAAVPGEYNKMWWLMFAYSLFYAPTLALTNSLSFHNLKDPEGEFPKIRMWGTPGWIFVGWLVLFVRHFWQTENWAGGSDLLMIAAGCSLLMGLFCLALPHTPPKREGENPFAFLEALQMLKDKNFFIFVLVSFVITTELQFYYIPTAPFLIDMGSPEKYVAAIKTVAQIAEFFVMWLLLHRSMKRFGVRKTMAIGILAWPLRYFLFCIPNLGVVIASLTLHGFGYAFFFVASQIYVNMKAQDDMRASAQAMLTFFTLGLGNFLGTMFTGWIWGVFGGPAHTVWWKFFMVPAGLCLVMGIIFLLFFKDDVKAGEGQADAA